MVALKCNSCGATDFSKMNGLYICQYCGVQYEMPVQKEVKNSNTSSDSEISLDDDVSYLLNKCKTEPWNAKKYANLILDIDPSNSEVYKYL